MPEIAVVLPAIGLPPSAANISNQLGYGERQGPDSNPPQVEGRIVGQFKLDNSPSVALAQLIFSFEEGHSTAIVLEAANSALTNIVRLAPITATNTNPLLYLQPFP